MFTTELSQLVLTSLKPGEDIGEKTHNVIDRILSFVAGTGEAVGESRPIKTGSFVIVPAGAKHDFINNGTDETSHVLRAARPRGSSVLINLTNALSMLNFFSYA